VVERFHQGNVHVYEVPDALPRTFVSNAVSVQPDRAAVLRMLAATPHDRLASTAVIEAGPGADRLRSDLAAATSRRSSSASRGSATITSFAPDRVAVDVTITRSGVLILTDVMAPGWIAERDGKPAPIETVDATFRGVVVDGSTRSVVFRYVPTFTYAGFAVAALAWLVSVGWGVAVRSRDRRRVSAEAEASGAERSPIRNNDQPHHRGV
jgi:hypothetical protein